MWERTRLLEAQQLLAQIPGVTVLIHDQGCAAEARRLRKRGKIPTPDQRVVINHRICEGCGHCGEVSNCLSVQPIDTPFGRKTEIDQTTCNLDFSCLEGDCPSFMTVTPKKRAEPRARRKEETAAVRAQLPEPPVDLPEPARIVPDDEFAMRITGIGGTGVVTVAQVLGTAAMLDGYHVRGLDQIGLSQKAGPVVSDLRLSRSQPTATNRLGEGQADLLLAFDQLVAASEKGLLVAEPSRTAVVGSTSPTPTGEMITHPGVQLPSPGDLTRRIAGVTRSDAQHWADAFEITEDLFGRATTANVFVVGMAYQAGCLPISAKHIEEAIGLNATAVEANLAAFRWGRAQIAAPQAVAAARRVELTDDVEVVESAHVVPAAIAARIAALAAPPALRAALTRYAAELCAWQSARTARAWLDVLERVSTAERAVDPRQHAPARRGGGKPVQADGVQGRVRSRAIDDRCRRARRRARGRGPARQDRLEAPPAAAARDGPLAQDRDPLVGVARGAAAREGQAAARHAVRPVRLRPRAPDRARAARRVRRGDRPRARGALRRRTSTPP